MSASRRELAPPRLPRPVLRFAVLRLRCPLACALGGCAARAAGPRPVAVDAPVVAPEAPAPSASESGSPPAPPAPDLTCGELALRLVELRALGKGNRHPLVVATENGLASCPDRSPSAPACADARSDLARMEIDYGPSHPLLQAARVKVAACADVPLLPPPPPRSCAELHRERAALVAEGKGERHPRVVAVDAELARCSSP